MASKTSIEWTATVNADGTITLGSTWNPTRGCSMAKGSELGGCLNCYAAAIASRFSDGPFKTFARRTENGPRWTGKVVLVEEHLRDPLRWKKPRKIFVNSMSDLFHEALPDESIDRVFAVMALCPQHTFQCLTKRPGRMLKYFSPGQFRDAKVADEAKRLSISTRPFTLPSETIFDARRVAHGDPWQINAWPLPNVWLGISCEDQKTADERIPLLLQTPAAVRFVSYEPALGPVNFWKAIEGTRDPLFGVGNIAHLDQIIVGGESGPGARPFDIAWARTVIKQCREAGVSCFVKQLGANPQGPEQSVPDWVLALDRKGGNWECWPSDLKVRQFPATAGISK